MKLDLKYRPLTYTDCRLELILQFASTRNLVFVDEEFSLRRREQ